jgi:thiol-disulfide isomerase/thioredoxin
MRHLVHLLLPALTLFGMASSQSSAQSKPPSVDQALGLKPLQPGVEHARPAADDVKKCEIEPEKIGNATAWIVRDPQGVLLRRFSDTNGDNVVDQWSYFDNGLEVYRDIDADFNGKADQYRWFHTGGTRWGLDRNQDGKIDSWKTISPHEVTEEVVTALQTKNEAAFQRLLPSEEEIAALGISKSAQEALAKRIAEAPSKFRELAGSQKVISPDGKFVDFGAARPGLIPAGTDGSTKDVMVYENVSALVDQGGKPEQLYVGTLVRIGDSWRALGAPQLEAGEGNPLTMTAAAADAGSTTASSSQPSEAVQKLLESLQKLDQQMAQAPPAEQTKLLEQRIKTLRDIANASPDQDHWVRELAEMLGSAAQAPGGANRIAELQGLEKQLVDQKASEDLIAHVGYRRIWADFYANQRDPKADFVKIQEKYLAELQEFVKAHPTSAITAEALLELGRTQEFGGEAEEAQKWYEQLAKDFPNTPIAQKAAGAVRRLKSPGQAIQLRGTALQGGTVDLTAYRGKVVLIQYWSTWCEPCKEDMAQIKDLYARYGQRGFDVIGVNLDKSAVTAQQYLTANRFPWKHLYDEGGLDGTLANDMGVMTLPLMLLVDKQGKVVNRNVSSADLPTELQRLFGAGTATNGGSNLK